MPEFINPNPNAVSLTGPDGHTITVDSGARIDLPEYFDRYCARGLLQRTESYHCVVLRPHGERAPPPQVAIAARAVDEQQLAIQQISTGSPVISQNRVVTVRRGGGGSQPRVVNTTQIVPQGEQHTPPSLPPRQPQVVYSTPQGQVVGRQIQADGARILQQNLQDHFYPISNGIGVGILSYNRAGSLRRLIDSLGAYTDLRRTTVFVSDDASTDDETRSYLESLRASKGFTVLMNERRLGVAGNSNRLLRCLARFRYGIILNDDVEILARDWERFYVNALAATGLHHLCMRQPGVYGAQRGTGLEINGIKLDVIQERPHGAVLVFTNAVLNRVGYFDQGFGLYGMEHVDWSTRVTRAGLQGPGYFDVVGSDSFIRIHADDSAVAGRQELLSQARRIYDSLDHSSRVFIDAAPDSAVPSVSVVIPCRDLDRSSAIRAVVNNIRGQHFPAVQIVVVEHDVQQRLGVGEFFPVEYRLMASGGGLFNKSKAFNLGVSLATADTIILHDADMMVQENYTQIVHTLLQSFEACHVGKTVIYANQASTNQICGSGAVDSNVVCDRVVGYFEGGSLACRRDVFWRVGAFNEDFNGYGCEDCEFYNRLSVNSRWMGERRLDFLHLWHGRADGWMAHHEHNKGIDRRLRETPMDQRLAAQYHQLRRAGYEAQLLEAGVRF